MPQRFEMPPGPEDPDENAHVDLTKRYDVYSTWHNHGTAVFRNVKFKGTKMLFSRRSYDFMASFIELERANGETVFISRVGLVAFCEHGRELGAETHTKLGT